MSSLEQLLAEHPFFMGLKPEHIGQLSEYAAMARVEGGEFLFREGEIARAFYVIRHGSVAVASITPHEGLVVIQTVGAGEVLGWSWLLPPYRWHFGAYATEPTSVVAIDAGAVRARAEQDPAFGYEVMRRFAQVMASRLEATHLQLMNVYEHRR
jgi:CRP-like cAMP-binding protein